MAEPYYVSEPQWERLTNGDVRLFVTVWDKDHGRRTVERILEPGPLADSLLTALSRDIAARSAWANAPDPDPERPLPDVDEVRDVRRHLERAVETLTVMIERLDP